MGLNGFILLVSKAVTINRYGVLWPQKSPFGFFPAIKVWNHSPGSMVLAPA